MQGSADIVLVPVTGARVADVQVTVGQDGVLATHIRVGVDVHGSILYPGSHHHVIRYVAGHLATQDSGVASYDVLIIHLNVVFLLYNCKNRKKGIRYLSHGLAENTITTNVLNKIPK